MDIVSTLGTVLFTSAATILKDALVEAVRRGADLYGADLRSANLYGANLYGADLRSADLRSADLRGANLRSANLYGANLYGADLRSANLYGANLYGADLRSANLRSADLRGADLYGANLRSANLYGANLYGADLRSANLYGANLYGADLRSADLRSADLYGANLHSADLRSANLRSANLYGANLCGADLYGANNIQHAKGAELQIAQLQFIPEEGSFVAWKKCKEGVVVKLMIPADAKRSHGSERKCRASKVKVIEVFGAEVGVSNHDSKVTYKKGKTVKADSFDDDRWKVCAPGIHFFVTRQEAEDYTFLGNTNPGDNN